MHICLVTSGRPSEVGYGGEARFIISIRKWLLENGHDVTIVERRLFGSGTISSEDSLGVFDRIEEQPSSRVLMLPAPVYSACMLLASLLIMLRVIAVNRRSAISIIHAQDTGYGGLAAVMAGKVLNLPVVISSHGLRYASLSNALSNFSARLLLQFEYGIDVFTCRTANLVVTVSSSQRWFFTSFGIKESHLRTIPVGVEIARFGKSSEDGSKVDNEWKNNLVIAFIGRLSPEKNPFTLVRAFEEASSRNNKLKLLFVGAGPLETGLRNFAARVGIGDKVVFLGVRGDIEQILQSVDIFTLPSFVEGCPISLLEAMASGKAIVASDIPSIREIVTNGEDAILVDPYDVKEWAKAILRLCKDKRLRNNLRRKAQQKSRIYDVETVYPQIIKMYQATLATCF